MPTAHEPLQTPYESPRFIVAEVSKNWRDGQEVTPTGPLAVQFERVINVNAARGYVLRQFQVHRMLITPTEMNETVIAVFERDAPRGLSDAHSLELERLLGRLSREDAGNFPLMQAVEAALACCRPTC
jgi:hypothetical protein